MRHLNWRCGAKNTKSEKFDTDIYVKNRRNGKIRLKAELSLEAQD